MGVEFDVYVGGTLLIYMYIVVAARKLFNEMPIINVVLWTALLLVMFIVGRGRPVERSYAKDNGHRVMTDSPCYNQYKDIWNTTVSVEIKVGDKIETIQFFHCYKRGVDRVFMDQPIFLEKVWGKTASKVYGLRLERITGITNFDLACCAKSHIQNLLKIVGRLGQVRGGWSNALSVMKWVYNRSEYKLKKNRFVYTKLLAVLRKARMPVKHYVFSWFEHRYINHLLLKPLRFLFLFLNP
ncbi:hypothetical protein GIB67_036147 [Kingdonia uniflora]|uniref:Uncharacterized protein n=1 Tax=Kingdonia uniflora TaxID=39325 RepID=A0A7J7N965_9MAGN|nr:hypothetical protein GIB67_036147 [Kingdonia uniflora]